jgi:hypothetical protein
MRRGRGSVINQDGTAEIKGLYFRFGKWGRYLAAYIMKIERFPRQYYDATGAGAS